MQKIAIYVRVSSEEQRRYGHSIHQQIDVLTNKISSMNLDTSLIRVYNDAGYSSSRIDRPAYLELLKDCEAGTISHLFCYKLDRLNRNINSSLHLFNRLVELDIKLYTLYDEVSFDNPDKELHTLINAVFAYHEQRLISTRIKDGIEGGLKKGQYPFGRTPYGYQKIENKRLIFDPDTYDQIKEIIHDYIYTNLSINRLAAVYDLSNEVVKNILENEVYRGFKVYRDEKYSVTDDIYISNQEDVLINEKLNLYGKQAGINIYLFKNKLYCIHCGEKLRPTATYKKSHKYYYYKCINKSCHCSSKYVNEDLLVTLFSKVTSKIYYSDASNTIKNSNDEELYNKLNKYKKLCKNVSNQKDKLLNMYLNHDIGESQYFENKSKLDFKYAKFKEIIDEIFESISYTKHQKAKIIDSKMDEYYIDPVNTTKYYKKN